MVEIDSLFQTKTAKKDTLWHGTYLYSLNKGLPPPLDFETRKAHPHYDFPEIPPWEKMEGIS